MTESIKDIFAGIEFLPCAKCGTPGIGIRDRDGVLLPPRSCYACEGRAAVARIEAEETARAARSVPRRYAWASLGNLEVLFARVPRARHAKALVQSALHAERVILVGPAGSGKTSLAVALLRERSRATRTPGIFVPAYRLGVARIQHRAGDGEAALVEEASTSALVLIDDIGNERPTSTNAVPDVVFARYDDELPTILTTAFSPDEIGAKYGDGFARRLFEGVTVIDLGAAA